MGANSFPANESYPAMVYPNPLHPDKYVVLNTGLTIVDRDYNGDYGMPRWGDYAIVNVTQSFAEVTVCGTHAASPARLLFFSPGESVREKVEVLIHKSLGQVRR